MIHSSKWARGASLLRKFIKVSLSSHLSSIPIRKIFWQVVVPKCWFRTSPRTSKSQLNSSQASQTSTREVISRQSAGIGLYLTFSQVQVRTEKLSFGTWRHPGQSFNLQSLSSLLSPHISTIRLKRRAPCEQKRREWCGTLSLRLNLLLPTTTIRIQVLMCGTCARPTTL